MSRKKSYGQDTKEFQQAEIEEEQLRRKRVSRKAEIIRVLKKYTRKNLYSKGYCSESIDSTQINAIATEIEKLYGGKVEYVVQYMELKRKLPPQGFWQQMGSLNTEKSAKEVYDQEKRNSDPNKFKLRYLKRTTTDQIIEE